MTTSRTTHNLLIRIGDGLSHDKGTKWFTDKQGAIKYHCDTHKRIYVSVNKSRYQMMSLEELGQL